METHQAKQPAASALLSAHISPRRAPGRFLQARSSLGLLLLLLAASAAPAATPLDTEFWYAGFLTYNGIPANGNFDFKATLYDAGSGGNQVGLIQTIPMVQVVNGAFQFPLDFGPVFAGDKAWLELQTKPSIQLNYFTLSPRQDVTAAPYALFAPTAASANSVANNGVTGASIQSASITADKIAGGEVVKSFNGLHDAINLHPGSGISLATNGNTVTISSAGGGASDWLLTGNAGTIPGVNFLGTTDNQPLDLKVNNERGLHLEPANVLSGSGDLYSVNVIGGYEVNQAASGVMGATIAGGGFASSLFGGSPNLIVGDFGTIVGGFNNRADERGFIGGGDTNRADMGAVVGGGHDNWATQWGFIGGGATNIMESGYSSFGTIGGGSRNYLQGARGPFGEGTVNFATIGGGFGNVATGDYSTIPGGYGNQAGGRFSLAAGKGASAAHDGSFVWSDSAGGWSSSGDNEFDISASGGMHLSPSTSLWFGANLRQMINLYNDWYGVGVQDWTLYARTGGHISSYPDSSDGNGFAWYAGGTHSNSSGDPGSGGYNLMTLRYDIEGVDVFTPGAQLDVHGSIYCDGGVWASGFHTFSDRNRKTAIKSLDAEEILNRVLGLPVTSWSFTNAPDVRHIGPMAQDFHAAFNLGDDDRSIVLGDEGGVALAAIQGLNQKVEAQRAELKARQTEIDALKSRLTQLEQVVSKSAH